MKNKPPKPLRLLIVEDNPNDAELMLRELRRSGFEPDWKRVDTESEYLASLQPELDLILSDYAMPEFSGLRALELLKTSELGVPFIIVSATIGEETAVAAMQSGAADYLLKDRLTRLGQAVQQALEQKRTCEERNRADEALERLRRRHELILHCAGEGIYGLDLNGNIIFGNPKAAELLGWEAAELLGRPAHATIHHKHADGRPYPIESCSVHGPSHAGATRRVTNDAFWRKDGTSFRADCVCSPFKDEHGQIAGSIVTFKDITEQFAAEMRLKLQEQQYRLLFDTNPNPMWVYDAKTFQILAVNEAATAQYGYSRSEFLKLSVKDLQPNEEGPDLIKASALSSPLMSHFSGQFRHLRKNGSLILVEIYSGAILWAGMAARIVTAIDVTERKQAEESLREQADIIDRARDAIIVRDFTTDCVTVWNTGAERLYGWKASEAIGRPMAELIFAENNDRETLLQQLVSIGEFQGEIKHRARDGHEVIVNSRVMLVRNDDGTPRSVLGINTDITEQKKIEEQFLRAQRLESIGTLASGVAHDLNNILVPILMAAPLLRGDMPEEEREKLLTIVESSAERGASIVKQVLTFARGADGDRVLLQPIYLVQEIAKIAEETFPKSVVVRTNYPEDLWTIVADPTQVHQILLNLCINARDAMPAGGTLMMALENFEVDDHYARMAPGAKAGPHVILKVSDTGTGIPRGTIDKIFDPFFTTKGLGQGTGLGLSTVIGIVKGHGGFMEVDSEVGRGSNFKVFLPANVSELAAAQTTEAAPLPRANGELLLIVDDENSILEIAKAILEDHGYRVLTAADGTEALAIFAMRMSEIELVLTDLAMPFMDGVALISTLQKMKPDVRVIASTGRGGQEGRANELAQLNVRATLTKPYNRSKLITTLSDALSPQQTRNGNHNATLANTHR